MRARGIFVVHCCGFLASNKKGRMEDPFVSLLNIFHIKTSNVKYNKSFVQNFKN